MTSIPSSNAVDSSPSESPASSLLGILSRIVIWLEALGDRANPILVKETRQALKSRQFVGTFFIVLIACWIASFAVVAISGPSVYYGAEGSTMLIVYSAILAFPLMLIVPYSAYRSLAAEQEDNTYDLLSITTLTTGQIIAGKLGSAVVQMLVYLSAVTPCIAFTYLLRGVDALTILMVLVYFFLASLGLSLLALMAGTAAKVRYTQVILSVLLVLGLAWFFFVSVFMVGGFIQESYSFLRETWFWIGNLAFLTVYVTTFALIHAAASAQIAFSSENRSTPIRRIMFLQQACFLGWAAGLLSVEDDALRNLGGAIFASAIVLGLYWYGMGTMLTSEWPYLSRRVQRSLPQSKVGRMFLTWFNPGPGTGYVFCVANLSMIAGVGLLLNTLFSSTMRGSPSTDQVFYLLLLGWAYTVLFLGVGRLLISLARRFVYVSMTAGFLLHMILLLAACGLPQILAFMSSTNGTVHYGLLHMTNPIWTFYLLIDNGPAAIEAATLSFILIPAAMIVLLLNMRSVSAEMQYQRSLLPARVSEEEAELHPEPEAKASNPWEEDEKASQR